MTVPAATDNRYRIGIDLGGTKIEAALLSPEGGLLRRFRVPSPAASGYEAVVAEVVRVIAEAAAVVPVGGLYTVGIGIPGSVDRGTGLVRNANSTCLIGKPLKRDLQALLQLREGRLSGTGQEGGNLRAQGLMQQRVERVQGRSLRV